MALASCLGSRHAAFRISPHSIPVNRPPASAVIRDYGPPCLPKSSSVLAFFVCIVPCAPNVCLDGGRHALYVITRT